MHAAYTERLDDAIALAVADFRHVRRKGTEIPYLTHLLAVTALVGEHGGDEDQLIAAILHDWLEDVEGASAASLEARFGARVARIVAALSDSEVLPKPPWAARKLAYVARLAGMPAEVKLVSAADKLHNARSLRLDVERHGLATLDRFTGGRQGLLWYYTAVHDALTAGWSHPLVALLAEEVGRLLTAAHVDWDVARGWRPLADGAGD
jgi:(p)ppGpp synthase/HD superfamily hydrolase